MTTSSMGTEELAVPRAKAGGGVRGPWRRRTISILAAASLALVWLVSAPAQAQTTQCTGTLQNGTVLGQVVVPDGAACTLINMNVLGPVSVGKSADLLMSGSMVAGIVGQSNSFVYAEDGSVVAGGGITLNDAFGLWLIESLNFGTVAVNGTPNGFMPSLYMSDDTSYAGNLNLANAWSVLQGGQINGAVTSKPGVATDLVNMTVTGKIDIQQSSLGALLCGLALGNSMQVRDGGGIVQIGGPFPTPSCASNFVSGNVDVHNNAAVEIQISGNIVSGNLACTGNSPAPVGFGNIVFGTTSGQCAGLSILGGALMSAGPLIPPPNVPGSREAVTPDDRRGDIEKLLLERLEAAGGNVMIGKQTQDTGDLGDASIRLAP